MKGSGSGSLPGLSEPGQRLLGELEARWCRRFLKGDDKPQWSTQSLLTFMQRGSICPTQLEGRQILDELHRAGVLDVPESVSFSPRLNLTPRIGLAAWRCAQLSETLPAVTPELMLTPRQAICWNQALAGVLKGWSPSDQYALVVGLRALASDLPEAYRLVTYAASARYLLASSKLLDRLPNGLLREFGIEPTLFDRPDAWLLASMPTRPESVLLIENSQSYMQALRLGVDHRIALVCSFGYGLSLGEALSGVERVRLVSETPLSLTLRELLALPHLTYWGDLDPEGLRIYRRLQSRLPALRLSALYAPMIDALEGGGGHILHEATGKSGQVPAGAWKRGVDQEWIEDTVVCQWAGQVLAPELERRWLEWLGDERGT